MTSNNRIFIFGLTSFASCWLGACSDNPAMVAGSPSDMASADEALVPRDPDSAEEVVIDRFSAEAGTLMVRDDQNGLPAAGAPIDFDQGPFITRGFGPDGERVRYYNFDVQSTRPAPIYVLFRDGATQPVPGQLNIVDTIPGDGGYNDFWQVTKVTVPEGYVPNSLTSFAELEAAAYPIEPMDMLVNCPIVPGGSGARLRLEAPTSDLTRGWYRGDVIHYFTFDEKPLSGAAVPVAPIYVTFNVNPPEGGPPSGFRTELGGAQTHNVISALPSSAGYSPLWSVNPYDNADFESVIDLESASGAHVLAEGVANVNCPVVDVDGG